MKSLMIGQGSFPEYQKSLFSMLVNRAEDDVEVMGLGDNIKKAVDLVDVVCRRFSDIGVRYGKADVGHYSVGSELIPRVKIPCRKVVHERESYRSSRDLDKKPWSDDDILVGANNWRDIDFSLHSSYSSKSSLAEPIRLRSTASAILYAVTIADHAISNLKLMVSDFEIGSKVMYIEDRQIRTSSVRVELSKPLE